MVMGGKQCLGAKLFGACHIFQNSSGDSHAVVCRSTSADLVQNQKTPGSGVLENGCHLGHLHHKSGLTGGQVITGADSGKHPIHKTDPGAAGGDKRAHLRHENDQRNLPHIGGFTCHVGTGDDTYLIVSRA